MHKCKFTLAFSVKLNFLCRKLRTWFNFGLPSLAKPQLQLQLGKLSLLYFHITQPPGKVYFGHSLHSIYLMATLQINLLMLARHNLVLVDSLASCGLSWAVSLAQLSPSLFYLFSLTENSELLFFFVSLLHMFCENFLYPLFVVLFFPYIFFHRTAMNAMVLVLCFTVHIYKYVKLLPIFHNNTYTRRLLKSWKLRWAAQEVTMSLIRLYVCMFVSLYVCARCDDVMLRRRTTSHNVATPVLLSLLV